jgi:hypothetical protein
VLLLNTAAHTARQQVLLSKGAVAGLLMMQGSDTYLNFLSTTVSSTPKASTSCRKCNSSGVAEQQYHNCLDLAAERQAHLGDEEAVTLIQRHVVQGLSRPDAATFKTSAEKEGRLSRRKGGA